MAFEFTRLTERLLPVVGTVRSYDLTKARSDLMAGLTVTVVGVPQAMAFALIAGLNPIYGLYGLIIQTVIGSLFTSSNQLSIGPTNTISLLVASVTTSLVGSPENAGETYVLTVATLALISGAIQLVFGVARLGAMFRYVSHSVIVGFTAGAGLLIIAKQLRHFFGIPKIVIESPQPGLRGVVQEIGPNVLQIDPQVLLVGVCSLTVMVGARRISRKLPGPLLAVAAGSIIVVLLGWHADDPRVVGPLAGALPSPNIPEIDISRIEGLLRGGVAIALLGMLEAVAIGKSLALKAGERIDAAQEPIAQGITNVASSFFGCYPGTGSFSRSALNYTAGARTPLASTYCGIFVAVALVSFGELGRYLPKASLAAILFVVAWGLIDPKHLGRIMRSHRSDAAVCVVTLLATLVIPLEYAIFVGIFLNIALYLRRASHLHAAEMVTVPGGRFIERPLHAKQNKSGSQKIVFVQFEGDLFFGIADQLQDRLAELDRTGVKILIIRLKRTHSVDFTAMTVLEKFACNLKDRGGQLILCGIKPELLEYFRRFGLVDLIGKENVFETTFGVFTSAKKAIARARALLGSSIDTDGLDLTDDEQGWMYQI